MVKQDVFYNSSTLVETICGDMFVHTNYTDKEQTKLAFVKVTMGKAGGCLHSHLESKVAFINAILKNTDTSKAVMTLLDASGHKCSATSTSCHDILIRLILGILMGKED